MGFLVVLTLGAAGTLAYIGREASLQGNTRREIDAFFAAEAGLAEGRERMRLLAEGVPGFANYSSLMAGLPPAAAGWAGPGDSWFEVIPATAYTMAAGAAIDTAVAGADRELRDLNGQRYNDFPTGATVSYRVFLRDDLDEAVPNPAADTNGRVWLVSVGEVTVFGGQPVRRVTQVLISFTSGTQGAECVGQRGGCSDKTNASTLDVNTPDTTGGVVSL